MIDAKAQPHAASARHEGEQQMPFSVRVAGRLRHQDFSDLTTETWILSCGCGPMIDDFEEEHD